MNGGLFALGDLHLSLFRNKSMDIFGENWANHHIKIKENWLNAVAENDTVLIPGDISWAMSLTEAMPDLEFIEALPGKKVLLKGNHDFWWSSASRLNSMFKTMYFMQNDFYALGSVAICGSRGWLLPEDAKFEKEDMKIYQRELGRFKLSLEAATRKGFDNIIFMSHFPLLYKNNRHTGFTEILKEYGVKQVFYGHLHGSDAFDIAYEGESEGIKYSLVSADYINFSPLKIF